MMINLWQQKCQNKNLIIIKTINLILCRDHKNKKQVSKLYKVIFISIQYFQSKMSQLLDEIPCKFQNWSEFWQKFCMQLFPYINIQQLQLYDLPRINYQMKYKNIPIHDIVIYKHPLLYLELVLKVVLDVLLWIKNICITRSISILILLTVVGLISSVQFLHPIKMFLVFAAYWILLGVASSIGLGTGLHTFVLYLGPHIAKVAMVATNCGHLPEMIPSRWEFDHFAKCEDSSETIGFFGILLAVQIQSFLWGLGTALGELPPYFVAKKAADIKDELHKMEKQAEIKDARTSQERQKLMKAPEEIDEVTSLQHKQNKTFIDKAKILIYNNIQKYGFITILIGASIPNPLFDLAGITCGHFRVPFKKFFTATFIGKAIIKVHIQMLFVITVFRKQTVDAIVNVVRKLNEGFADLLTTLVEKQRQNLHHPSTSDDKGIVGTLWDFFIMFMVGYFLLSIVTSEVQEKAVKLKDKQN